MSKLKNYVRKSDANGWYSYRRRIPAKLKNSFLKSDGKPRWNEWKQAIKTKSKSVALKRAVEINDKFEQTKVFAKARLKRLGKPRSWFKQTATSDMSYWIF